MSLTLAELIQHLCELAKQHWEHCPTNVSEVRWCGGELPQRVELAGACIDKDMEAMQRRVDRAEDDASKACREADELHDEVVRLKRELAEAKAK